MAPSSYPTSGIALQITERYQKKPLTLARVEIPALGDGEVLIENVTAAQNFGDPLCVDYDILIPSIPHTNGWDCAGKIIAVGKGVTDFQIGDRVCCVSSCLTARHGGYQQYTIANILTTSKIPDDLTFEEATTFSLAFATSIGGLNTIGIPSAGVDAKLPLPAQPASVAPVLVWGGASSVGAMAIQLVKLSGFRVIATASPSSFELVKSMGADWVVDYHDAEKAVQEIREAAGGRLSLAFDAISLPPPLANTTSLCIKSFGPEGGKLAVVSPRIDLTNSEGRDNVKLLYGGGSDVRDKPELHNTFKLLERLLAQKALHVHPFEVIPDGLMGVNEGWRRQRAGLVRAQKLVYKISETPGLADL